MFLNTFLTYISKKTHKIEEPVTVEPFRIKIVDDYDWSLVLHMLLMMKTIHPL